MAFVIASAGCGSNTTSGAPELQGSGSSSPAVAVPAVTTPPSSSATSSPNGTAPGLTPTGSTLQVGQPAKVQYEVATLSKDTSTLAITVTSVKQGSISDLKDFNLDAQSKIGVPFYVTVTFKNVGAKSLKPSGIFGTISALNAAGDEASRLSLIGDFPKCQGTPPSNLVPGAGFTECEVYIAPVGLGQSVASVVFNHYVDSGLTPVQTKITWTM